MIDTVLGEIAEQLNQHLSRRFPGAEDRVLLSDLRDSETGGGQLLLFLAGVECASYARLLKQQIGQPIGQGPEPGTPDDGEPLELSLLMMCAANSAAGQYREGLAMLSEAIDFFHCRPVLDRSNAPTLDMRIERLLLSIENLSSAEMHSLWAILSGCYLPSVLYRVRLVGAAGPASHARRGTVRRSDGRELS